MSRLVLDRADFRDRVHACWLGKSIGGTLGTPHEGKRCQMNLTFYDPVPTTALPNDDLDLQLVWLAAMEEANTTDPSVAQLTSAWTRWADAYPWNEYGFFMRNRCSTRSAKTGAWIVRRFGSWMTKVEPRPTGTVPAVRHPGIEDLCHIQKLGEVDQTAVGANPAVVVPTNVK